jgi:predicted  nucleic acid-binding Zn-ribbon protein
MNRTLTALIQLQKLDLRIRDLAKIAEGKIPELVREQEKTALLERRLSDLATQHKQKQKEAGLKELELRDHEVKIDRYREQLNQVKDNKSYKTLLGEIETVKKTSEQFETSALEALEAAEAAKKEMEQIKAVMKGSEKTLKELEHRNAVATKEAREELETLRAERVEVAGRVEAEMLSKYEQVFRSRGGNAISRVRGRSCQGCFTAVSPQIYNQLMGESRVTFCHSCGRILYLESEESPAQKNA